MILTSTSQAIKLTFVENLLLSLRLFLSRSLTTKCWENHIIVLPFVSIPASIGSVSRNLEKLETQHSPCFFLYILCEGATKRELLLIISGDLNIIP